MSFYSPFKETEENVVNHVHLNAFTVGLWGWKAGMKFALDLVAIGRKTIGDTVFNGDIVQRDDLIFKVSNEKAWQEILDDLGSIY